MPGSGAHAQHAPAAHKIVPELNSHKQYLTVADLLTDESFVAWQLKQDAIAEQAWKNWLAQKPGNALLAEEAVQLLHALINIRQERLSDYQINTSIERLLKKIQTREKRMHLML